MLVDEHQECAIRGDECNAAHATLNKETEEYPCSCVSNIVLTWDNLVRCYHVIV